VGKEEGSKVRGERDASSFGSPPVVEAGVKRLENLSTPIARDMTEL
jgi:hypothetical protein